MSDTTDELVELIRGRIHSEFDGECHLTDTEAHRIANFLSEADKREREARAKALGDAASTHEARVTELRNDPTSYKNGKITKSAKRASDFHERSAQVILALQLEER